MATVATPIANGSMRTSVKESVKVLPDGSQQVKVEETFSDGTKQIKSRVYPAGVPVPSSTQQLMQPQYTPPVMPQGLPTLTSPEDNRPCGGKGCLIGGSICLTVSILCGCFVVLPVVVMIIVWSTVDIDFDDDYY